jgi:hypothetical protein
MSGWAALGLMVGIPLGVYIVARLVFFAWFFTKQQFNKEKRNG